jgi:hypothetical protein
MIKSYLLCYVLILSTTGLTVLHSYLIPNLHSLVVYNLAQTSIEGGRPLLSLPLITPFPPPSECYLKSQ